MIATRAWLGVGLALGAVVSPRVAAQTPESRITVRLITIGPGPQVWERFGHNALWLQDVESGTDLAYDYGRFSFETKNFYLNFIRGEMRYWMGRADARALLDFYGGMDRTIVVQTLDLPVEARVALRDFLVWNIQPDNRFYGYDYYRDNCSTRIRDALDRALGGLLRAEFADTIPGASFRFHTDRLVAPLLWAFTATRAGLGPRTDRPISRWEETFVPMKLEEYLRDVRIADPAGIPRPLVAREDTLVASTTYPHLAGPPSLLAGFVVAGLLLGAILFGASRVSTAAFGALAFVLTSLSGLGGAILLVLWFLTSHVMTTANQNVLQLNPLGLVTAALLPWGIRAGHPRAGRLLVAVTGIVAIGSVLGLLTKVLPFTHQANAPIIALFLPAHLAILAALLLGTGRGGLGSPRG